MNRKFALPANSLKRLVLVIGLSWIDSPAAAWAGFQLSTFQAGPNGGAQVEGFVSDNKSAYTSTPDQWISNSVEGSSGIEGEEFANYFAQMTYFVPSTGGSLSVSGNWMFQTDLSTRTANIGAGLLFDSYLYITAGEFFEISGPMRNAGITFHDPDGQDVFPFTSNYFRNGRCNFALGHTRQIRDLPTEHDELHIFQRKSRIQCVPVWRV